MQTAPRFDIDMDALWHDPYPQLARLRAEAPVAFVPQLDGIVFTRRDDIDIWEKRIDIFSSEQPGGLMTRLMGQNMMRHDGDAHQSQRRAMQPAVSPRAVQRHWRNAFREAAVRVLDELAPKGRADLCTDYAMTLSGEALRLIIFDRMPWPRADILFKARAEWQGRDAWVDRVTRLKLRQAFGRLIRRATDRGVFVMLDRRLPTRLTSAFPPGVRVERIGLAEAVSITGEFLKDQ